MIDQLLARYSINTEEDHFQALREIMQEIALAGLYRGGFFEKAAFYGGTALRIFSQLDRFSEDLDFSLLEADPEFSLSPYFTAIKKEFDALGIAVDIDTKEKKHETAIQSAFLKSNTSIHELQLMPGRQLIGKAGGATRHRNRHRPIRIKFEVDTQPPGGFGTEEKLLLLPFSFYVKCYQVSDLFAGKLHALLYRRWKNRVKGRDWYDFEWYIRRGQGVHLAHFLQRAQQSGELLGHDSISIDELKALMLRRIERIDFEQAKQDVLPFIRNVGALDIWSRGYFSDLVQRMTGW